MKIMSEIEKKNICFGVLLKFHKICKEYNLHYWLGYGTLLGCIRHKGFIPWDDDVDVVMPRTEYNKLCKLSIWNNSKIDMGIVLVTRNNNDSYFRPYARINDVRTKEVHGVMMDYDESGVGIDVFPLDGFGDNYGKAQRKIKFLVMCKQLINSSLYKNKRVVYMNESNPIKHLIKYILAYSHWKNPFLIDYIIKKGSSDDFARSKYVGYAFESISEIMPNEVFRETIDGCFEGAIFPIPKNYDLYLSRLYGDYMTPPPVEKRATHPLSMCFWR